MKKRKNFDITTKYSAMSYAIFLLAQRDYSIYKITSKLHEKGYRTDDIDEASIRLVELGYLDDNRFCDAFIRSKKNGNGWGEQKIRSELKMKHGIKDDIIDEIIPHYDFEQEKIKRYIKKFGATEPVDNKDYQRRVRFLASRGFSFGIPTIDELNNFNKN